jgi:predicted RND superfamily exporter protein
MCLFQRLRALWDLDGQWGCKFLHLFDSTSERETLLTRCNFCIALFICSFESILFSISIGIGSDYILHASHTYSMAPDIIVSREERTRYAILHIGPSIIGSAFTTLSTAIIMMFTENEFSRKLATMLIVTILQAFIGFFTLCSVAGSS